MNELKERVQALIDKYSPELSAKGLKILLAKRYFESEVSEEPVSSPPGRGMGGIIVGLLSRAYDRKAEAKKYFYERNKYHTFVITVVPCDKTLLPKDVCRDYAFILKKTERAHLGQEPTRTVYKEEKLLSKIEKRILKILKKAEKAPPQEVCRNNIFDAFRYSRTKKYGYKKSFMGKERYEWDIIFIEVIFIALLIIIILCMVLWLIFR